MPIESSSRRKSVGRLKTLDQEMTDILLLLFFLFTLHLSFSLSPSRREARVPFPIHTTGNSPVHGAEWEEEGWRAAAGVATRERGRDGTGG
jgi:hypothetical protein